MHRLKGLCWAIIASLLVTLAGCSSEDGKVNIINGPGKANSTMLVSFTELCSGTADGFLGTGKQVLAHREDGSSTIFELADSEKGTSRQLYKSTLPDSSYVNISADGRRFLVGNCLVDVASGQTKQLPDVDGILRDNPAEQRSYPSYSFLNDSELLLTNPFYYMQKYYSSKKLGLGGFLQQGASAIGFTRVRESGGDPSSNSDGTSPLPEAFRQLNAPELVTFQTSSLIEGRLKYIFIGETADGNTPLYLLDFHEKKFTLIANRAIAFSLSPGKSLAAYVTEGQNGGRDRLMTLNLETGEKKELLSLPQIQSVAWSRNGSWIAYSGGNSKTDIGIIRADGTSNEQLTNGMRPTGVPVWSANGKQLAFTSYGDQNEPKIYIITLNTPEESWKEASSTDPTKREEAEKLLEGFRYETRLVLGSTAQGKNN